MVALAWWTPLAGHELQNSGDLLASLSCSVLDCTVHNGKDVRSKSEVPSDVYRTEAESCGVNPFLCGLHDKKSAESRRSAAPYG